MKLLWNWVIPEFLFSSSYSYSSEFSIFREKLQDKGQSNSRTIAAVPETDRGARYSWLIILALTTRVLPDDSNNNKISHLLRQGATAKIVSFWSFS